MSNLHSDRLSDSHATRDFPTYVFSQVPCLFNLTRLLQQLLRWFEISKSSQERLSSQMLSFYSVWFISSVMRLQFWQTMDWRMSNGSMLRTSHCSSGESPVLHSYILLRVWSIWIYRTAVFSFEGIGLVIPITESMKDPHQFPRVLTGVMLGVMVLFAGAGVLAYAAYGSAIQVSLNLL